MKPMPNQNQTTKNPSSLQQDAKHRTIGIYLMQVTCIPEKWRCRRSRCWSVVLVVRRSSIQVEHRWGLPGCWGETKHLLSIREEGAGVGCEDRSHLDASHIMGRGFRATPIMLKTRSQEHTLPAEFSVWGGHGRWGGPTSHCRGHTHHSAKVNLLDHS